ncbi:MAG: M15 family metallopeptidase [Clostridia bacterium]|nr:M15 family metallopeptidase [Clostridia bacterium]
MNESKKPDYLVLVNEDNRLPENFEDTIEIITVENAVGNTYQIEKKTYEAFMRLREELLENDGIQAELISVYRTIPDQEATFNRYVEKFGMDYARTYAALPGHSEHHTGLAIDVGVMIDGKLIRTIEGMLELDHLFKIMQSKLPKYGFILRYPKGKEAVTKIGYECWHFRYIDSPALAKEITDQGICFEEYWEKA